MAESAEVTNDAGEKDGWHATAELLSKCVFHLRVPDVSHPAQRMDSTACKGRPQVGNGSLGTGMPKTMFTVQVQGSLRQRRSLPCPSSDPCFAADIPIK